jgi:ribosomal protein S18 acetylase RimI-like enzyme
MSPSEAAVIEAVQERHLADLARLQKDFLKSKVMCCCIPIGVFVNEADVRKAFHKCPEMMKVTAVALVEDQVVGFIQVILHGMPCEKHSVEKGEAYVYMIAVDTDARGMGIGSKLLDWADEIGRQRGCEKCLWKFWAEIKPLDFMNERDIRLNPHPVFPCLRWFSL